MFLRLLAKIVTASDVPLLMQRLEHSDDNVRLACAQTLARFPSVGVRGALYKLLNDAYPMLRIAALEGLERLRLPLDLKALCKLLGDEDRGVRREVKKLLVRCHDPQLPHRLFDILEDPAASEVHAEATDLLGALRDTGHIQMVVAARPRAVLTRDVLLRLLEAPQTRTRQVALIGLVAVQSSFDIECICPLLWDEDFHIRQLAVTILTHHQAPQTLATLSRALRDESAEARQGAIGILNVIVNTPLLKSLLLAVRGEEEHIASRITQTLGHKGGPQLIHTALQLITDTNDFLRTQVQAILQLTEDPTVVPYLAEILTDGEPWVRQCAMEMLGLLGERSRDAVPALLERAQTEEEESVQALQVLIKICDPRAIPVCLSHMQRGTPTQRKIALQALAVLTDAENFDVVLESILVLRDVTDADLKAHFNRAAAGLLKRFPEQMIRKHLRVGGIPSVSQVCTVRMPVPSAQPTSPLYILNKQQEVLLDPAAMAAGNVLGERYRVIRQIGKGGFGTVVLVEDTIVKEEVILKFLHPHLATDERMMQRFIQELRFARRITHENVIRIHDLLPVDNAYAISMEYFPSHNLSVEVGNAGFVQDTVRGCQVIASICRGMATAHHAGVIHRDLKPSNILLNETGLVKVADFGLAAMATERTTKLTSPGMMLGTPLYMPPEHVRNQPLDVRADVYSLGVMMYEMFTGTAPYTGADPLAILFQHVEGKASPPRTCNPNLPPGLDAVILKAMAVDPAQRFQDMEAFEKSLLPFLA